MEKDFILTSLVLIGTEKAYKLYNALTDGSVMAGKLMQFLIGKKFNDCFAVEKWLEKF